MMKSERINNWIVVLAVVGVFGLLVVPTNAQENVVATKIDGLDRIEYFETKVQPILKERCAACHADDTDDLGGNLALISRKAILTGGDSGAAVDLEDPDKSLLLDAINYGTYEMPPDGKLSENEIAILTTWVQAGIPWTAETAERMIEATGHAVPKVNAKSKAFWAFQKVQKPSVPKVRDEPWLSNDVDRFVLSRLEGASLRPAPVATRQALIRRLYYDLTGLPPAVKDVENFVSDNSELAYEKLVETLLASPHYGEKWGRHWLDLVRYAESNSFERDGTKPFVWRYRDYVIRSFNDDKPYDQFVVEQLAGDEINEPSVDSIVATGYYRLGQWDDEPADRKQALYDDLDDILATTSQVMMGLTINCARCHDHKIDPIPASDYYSMLSFFRNVKRYGVRGGDTVFQHSSRQLDKPDPPTADELEAFNRKVQWRQAAMREIIDIAKKDFKPVDHEDFQYRENHERLLHERLKNKTINRRQFDQYIRARNEVRDLTANPPNKIRVLCVKENENDPPATHILVRGNPHVPGQKVDPGFVSVLSPPEPEIVAPVHGKSSGRRLALAKWIASGDHPLTARVMANRIWQHHFGRGIVRSTSDFGFQGDQPTHPQLLDYLASQFVEGGWSIKNLHRLILNSSAYKMGNQFSTEAYEKDPLNNLFWRFDMRRLTAEEVRDSMLAVSGRLNRDKMYGPSVFPKLSQEVLSGQSMPGSGWGQSSDSETRRRSLYIHVKRSLKVPLLEAFDSADTDFTCPVRFNTTQPAQALALLNSDFANGEAKKFALVIAGLHDDKQDQVREILNRVTQNEPGQGDVDEGVALMDSWIINDGVSEEQALELFCLTAFNLNEFLFVE